jgi:heat shock protein HtpX
MSYTTDWGLRLRMVAVLFGLAVLYAGFAAATALYVGDVLLAVVLAGTVVGLQYWYGPRLALRAVDGERVDAADYPDLHDRVGRLARQAGVPTPAVAVADRSAPNAFATGRTQSEATVCVTTGLLERLDDDQLDAVLAHELAHVRNHDVVVLTVVSVLVVAAEFVVRHFWLFGDGGDGGGGGEQPWALVFVGAALASWVGGAVLTRAVSRYREYAADRGGAAITGDPASLAAAIETLETDGAADTDLREETDLRPSMNALFFRYEAPESRFRRLLQTHPPADRRVERLRTLVDDHGS